MDIKKQKKLLYEVSIIRPIVILLLVIMHSFCIYAGAWEMPTGIECFRLYKFLVKFIMGFRIEMIALVSGYVYAYQTLTLCRKYEFRSFAYKKFQRLIIPGLIFSLLYYFCFFYNKSTFGNLDWFLRMSSGCGHLWFLPMLFWCFLTIWCIDRYKLSSKTTFIILALFSILDMPKLPFGFSRVFHFAFYCYLGYVMYANKQKILDKFMKYKYIACAWASYFCLVCTSIVLEHLNGFILLKNAVSLFVACSGIFALYLLVCKLIDKPNYAPTEKVIKSSKLCYGVYVYHQFILVYLYYHTSLPQILGTYLLPWFSCIITLVLSILITNISLKSRIGRFLIG